jgi:hypothetical protein
MKTRWKAIKRALEAEKVDSSPRSPAEFWADFKARAELRPQEAAGAGTLRGHRGVLTWAAAAACTILVGIGVVWFGLIGTAGAVMATEVTELEVQAPHAAVIIMNDQPDDGTIVWIVGMEGDPGDGV